MGALDRYREARRVAHLAERFRAARNHDSDDGCDSCPTVLETTAAVVITDQPITAAATTIADAITYPAEHFRRWDTRVRDQQPLTFHPDGRITGHLAGTGCFRNGDMRRCVRYQPDPDPTLAGFHTWTTTLDDGRVIRTGAITAGSNHADLVRGMSPDDVRRIHEDTSTVIGRVVAWEDGRGRLAAAGSVVPSVDLDFLAQAAGAPVSIEQIPTVETNGRNTLVAAHMVVAPAWPVAS